MNIKTTLIIATIAIAATTLAISPMVTNPAFASTFPGSNGQGHETTITETCTNNGGKVKEGPCGGNSAESDNNDDTTTTITTAGKSTNEKDRDTTTR
jgi:hypothetical protein